MKSLLFFLSLIIMWSCQASKKTSAQDGGKPNPETVGKTNTSFWTFDKIEGNTLKFRDGNSFETGLCDLTFIGKIPVNEKPPFLIFSCRDCAIPGAPVSLYLHSPGNGNSEYIHKSKYPFPGTKWQAETNSLLFERIAFYGEVLTATYGIIWFEKLHSEGAFKEFISIARIMGGSVVFQQIDNQQAYSQTKALNSLEKNREIEGISHYINQKRN